jgi:hypothetical protein
MMSYILSLNIVIVLLVILGGKSKVFNFLFIILYFISSIHYFQDHVGKIVALGIIYFINISLKERNDKATYYKLTKYRTLSAMLLVIIFGVSFVLIDKNIAIRKIDFIFDIDNEVLFLVFVLLNTTLYFLKGERHR